MDVLRCQECGHVCSSQRGDPDYQAYYRDNPTDWEDPFWWDQAHRGMYDDFCARFLEGRRGRLLDVGCGLGFFVKRAGACAGWEAVGYEISPDAVRYARERLGLENVCCGRVEGASLPDGSFDLITLWDVIEHLPEPDALLQELARLLAPGGILFLHTPNAAVQLLKARWKMRLLGERPGGHYLEARDHLHLYTMRTLRVLLERNGFGQAEFFHLLPIQSLGGSRRTAPAALKNLWHWGARTVLHLSGGRVNWGNLYCVAQTKGR